MPYSIVNLCAFDKRSIKSVLTYLLTYLLCIVLYRQHLYRLIKASEKTECDAIYDAMRECEVSHVSDICIYNARRPRV